MCEDSPHEPVIRTLSAVLPLQRHRWRPCDMLSSPERAAENQHSIIAVFIAMGVMFLLAGLTMLIGGAISLIYPIVQVPSHPPPQKKCCHLTAFS
jgi:hypothetical protein